LEVTILQDNLEEDKFEDANVAPEIGGFGGKIRDWNWPKEQK